MPERGETTSAESRSRIEKAPFGVAADGTRVELYSLRNATGSSVAIATYGATVVSLRVPDRDGRLGDVVLGYDGLEGYLGSRFYFGAIVGRYANRIAGGSLKVRMTSYVELHARSAFSFLEGSSLPEELASRCAELDLPAMAVLDRDGVSGSPRPGR